MKNDVDTTYNNFFAWSLYTAYRKPIQIGDWITGEWPGQKIKNAEDMKQDIDFRIDMLIEALKVAISSTENCNDLARYFVVPEFYFHSAHGPYPGLKIGNLSAFEYLIDKLRKDIEDTIAHSSDSKNDWIICVGSILTTHVEDIEAFLQGEAVQERLHKLNVAYKKIKSSKKLSAAKSFIGLIRMKSFESKSLIGSSDNDYYELNRLVNEYRQDPLCTVRNRSSIFIYNGASKTIKTYYTEKQAESTVDLTLGVINENEICAGGQITEWLANYPSFIIKNGDNQDLGAINTGARISFETNNQLVNLGVEICLDHRLQRLRSTVNAAVDYTNNSPLDIQLVPSGGMQLLDYSIAAGVRGKIFNADGCDPILDQYNKNGKPILGREEFDPLKKENVRKPISGIIKDVITGVYTLSAQTVVKVDGYSYSSHSQLAFRTEDTGPEDFVTPRGTKNMGGKTFSVEMEDIINPDLDSYNVPNIKEVCSSNNQVNIYFTAGLGEIHHYSPKK